MKFRNYCKRLEVEAKVYRAMESDGQRYRTMKSDGDDYRTKTEQQKHKQIERYAQKMQRAMIGV